MGLVQVNDDSDLAMQGRDGDGQRLDSGYLLKAEPVRLAHGLDVR